MKSTGISTVAGIIKSKKDFHNKYPLFDLLLQVRIRLKENNDYTTADYIRDTLENRFNIKIIDTKGGYTWHEKFR